MPNEFTPLQEAAMKYTVKRAGQIEMPSTETVRDIISDAFTEGALWAVNNPVLTSDLRRKSADVHVASTGD